MWSSDYNKQTHKPRMEAQRSSTIIALLSRKEEINIQNENCWVALTSRHGKGAGGTRTLCEMQADKRRWQRTETHCGVKSSFSCSSKIKRLVYYRYFSLKLPKHQVYTVKSLEVSGADAKMALKSDTLFTTSKPLQVKSHTWMCHARYNDVLLFWFFKERIP